ncbi:MAG: polysaccharide deacetylase family protein [Kiritimatiellia bacterium]|jgi:peptidoglycan/xylan/chitin deacetylase (PgdA/CDA1 family)
MPPAPKTLIAFIVSLAILVTAGLTGRHFYKRHKAFAHLPMTVPILMYHDISPAGDIATADDVWTVQADNLAKHLQFLKDQGYTSVLPADLAAAAHGQTTLPSKPVLITFDDGFLSSVTLAEPLLKQYGFRGTVYLITAKIADTTDQRQRFRDTPCLTWPEVRTAMRRGTLSFGVHSHTHPKQPDAVAKEVTVSRDCFRAHTGVRPDSFCYPHGQSNPALEQAVRDAGYTTAMICEDEVALLSRETNLLALPRVSVFGGAQHFTVEVLPREQTGPNCIGGLVRNLGRPVRVAPRLLGTGMPETQTWLPETRLGPDAQDWRWPTADGIDMQKLRLEIWDRNRVLRLYTLP